MKSIEQAIPIKEYAHLKSKSEHQILSDIRAGKIMGRMRADTIVIFETVEQLNSIPTTTQRQGARVKAGDDSTSMELFLDHLSITKEEHQDLIHYSQSAMDKVTNATDITIKAKDSLIEEKDKTIAKLNLEVDAQKRTIDQLLQEREDLMTLTKTLSTKITSPT